MGCRLIPHDAWGSRILGLLLWTHPMVRGDEHPRNPYKNLYVFPTKYVSNSSLRPSSFSTPLVFTMYQKNPYSCIRIGIILEFLIFDLKWSSVDRGCDWWELLGSLVSILVPRLISIACLDHKCLQVVFCVLLGSCQSGMLWCYRPSPLIYYFKLFGYHVCFWVHIDDYKSAWHHFCVW